MNLEPIREIRKRYKSDYALAKELEIPAKQLRYFIDKDAFFNPYLGEFYVVAKTKAKPCCKLTG